MNCLRYLSPGMQVNTRYINSSKHNRSGKSGKDSKLVTNIYIFFLEFSERFTHSNFLCALKLRFRVSSLGFPGAFSLEVFGCFTYLDNWGVGVGGGWRGRLPLQYFWCLTSRIFCALSLSGILGALSIFFSGRFTSPVL